jgi:uncharacterized protein YydD (DUF2326 family)|tara:strand:- start:102 stop:350 length:249 start_codon:yes stop_codon:yes gene_type:complete
MTFGIKHEAASVLRTRFDDAYFDLKDELQDANDIRLLEELKIIYNQIIEDTIERGAYLQSSINDLQAHTDEMNHFIQGFKEK